MYKIISINIKCDELQDDPYWKLFEVTEDDKINFCVRIIKDFSIIHGVENYKIDSNYSFLFRRNGSVMLVDKYWKNALIFPAQMSCVDVFLCQLFYTHAVKRNILYFHSSLVKFKEKGIMFIGKSGIGKTTQAELWNRYRGAEIINGDVVFVQKGIDSFWAYGTPWHGSSIYCENSKVILSALIVLKQTDYNAIRKLTEFEKVTAVSDSVFYPRWLDDGMKFCVEILNTLLKTIPVYELSCCLDEEAVQITEKAVFGI